MFLALRDLRFATGRFALMAAVVALISLLLVMLSGLTAGLGSQNTAALDRVAEHGVQRVVFGGVAGQPAEASFTQSEFTREQREAWEQTDGVDAVEPLGVTQGRAVGLADGSDADATVGAGSETGTRPEATSGVATAAFLGLEPGSELVRDVLGPGAAHLAPGSAVLSRSVADELGVGPGEAFTASGTRLQVGAVVEDEHYSHSPVVWLAREDWAAASHTERALGTVGLVRLDGQADTDAVSAAADAAAGTTSASVPEAYAALPGYSSEHGSLTMMQALLYGISALVVLAFLSIWTVQRTREIAVLKALGASTGWVLRDALVQAGAVLLVGVLAGTAAAAGLGALAARAVPVTVDAATVLVPAAGVLALGLLGAALAVARVTRIDPLLALGGN